MHPYAAVGRFDELAREKSAGEIAFPDVVHDIQAAAGMASGERPNGERIEVVFDKDEAGAVLTMTHEGCDHRVGRGFRPRCGEAMGRRSASPPGKPAV